jgi:hypothetical protein
MAPLELTGGRVARPVVVLGASNVSRGLARLAAVVRSRAAAPAELFVAAGHGRGYGVTTRVGLRRLPSILASGLWRALGRERVEQPAALLTDVGNELLYGLGVTAVAAAVAEAAARLRDRGATLVITGLPLASIARVRAVRYRLLRTVYVPSCPLTLGQLQEGARWLDDELRAIAERTGAVFIEQPGDWYGLDAIHVKRSRLDSLWQRVADAWGLPPAAGSPRVTFIEWAAIGSRPAEIRSLADTMLFTPQPAVVRRGIRLSLY